MTRHSLFPVPKVLVPVILIWTGILAKWIATGDLDRVEIAAAVSALVYAILGYATPPTYDQVVDKVEKVVPTKPRRKRRRR